MINRRNLMLTAAGAATLAAIGVAYVRFRTADAGEAFDVTMPDAQWREKLGHARYMVLRHEDTERPFTSPLLDEKRAGIYHCAGCDLPAYSSDAKYDSGTGWPSFTRSLPNAIGTRADFALLMERTEVHCRRCGGHFGHIFDDGPKPTGKRHCLNGLALTFKPA